ncbi:MAG: hypothetical protein AAB243_04270 [Planctomycetota bacterium]
MLLRLFGRLEACATGDKASALPLSKMHKGLQTEWAVLLLIRNSYTGKQELNSVEWIEKTGKIVSYQWDIM